MARVRLLQLHQEQQQHGPAAAGSQSTGAAAAATNQWLDLVPSNPILPQIALPGTPSTAANGNNLHLNHSQDENGGSSSTESAHQTRRHGVQHQPSKIPVVKPTSCPAQSRPSSSYRGGDAQQYQSWTKCKSDQSLPRNWESINNNNNNKSNGGSSIGSGGGGAAVKPQRGGNRLDSSQYQQQQHRSRRDSGGGASLTRARSQNNHPHRGGAAKEFVGRTASSAAAAGGHQQQQQQQQPTAADDTNKVRPTKRFANILNSWMRKS